MKCLECGAEVQTSGARTAEIQPPRELCDGCGLKALARTNVRTGASPGSRAETPSFLKSGAFWCLLLANLLAALMVLHPFAQPIEHPSYPAAYSVCPFAGGDTPLDVSTPPTVSDTSPVDAVRVVLIDRDASR